MSDNMADKLKRKLSGKNITAMILFGAIIMVFVFFTWLADKTIGHWYESTR